MMTRSRDSNHSTRRITIAVAALAASLGLAACQADDGEPPADTGDMRGMPGMDSSGGMMGGMMDSAMRGGMMSDGMMTRMQAHMRMMDGAGADSMQAMLPMHRQMVANMMAQFNREMRDMNMQTDAAWNATVDSLRQDLVRLPELPASELASFMPAHQARMRRLMEAHGAMMANTKMRM